MEAVTPKKLLTYVTTEDKCPFDEWLDDLKDNKAVAQIQKRLIRVEFGNLGDYKSVGSGVLELRIHYGSGFRLYFGQQGNELILLCGGDKSSKTKTLNLLSSIGLTTRKGEKKMAKETRSYHDGLMKRLRADENLQIEHLKAAAEDADMPEVFLAALRDVVEARGFLNLLKTLNSTVNIFTDFFQRRQSKVRQLFKILNALGIEMTFQNPSQLTP